MDLLIQRWYIQSRMILIMSCQVIKSCKYHEVHEAWCMRVRTRTRTRGEVRLRGCEESLGVTSEAFDVENMKIPKAHKLWSLEPEPVNLKLEAVSVSWGKFIFERQSAESGKLGRTWVLAHSALRIFSEFRETSFTYKTCSVDSQPLWRMDALTHKEDMDVMSVPPRPMRTGLMNHPSSTRETRPLQPPPHTAMGKRTGNRHLPKQR